MSELTDLTIAGALSGLDKGEFTSRELTQAYIAEVENGRALNAFTTETPDKALEMADAADAARRSGDAGPLNGIPLAIKDLFCTKGVLTTASSEPSSKGSRSAGPFCQCTRAQRALACSSMPSDMSTPWTSSGCSSAWMRAARMPVPQAMSAIRRAPWVRSTASTSSWAGR